MNTEVKNRYFTYRSVRGSNIFELPRDDRYFESERNAPNKNRALPVYGPYQKTRRVGGGGLSQRGLFLFGMALAPEQTACFARFSLIWLYWYWLRVQ